MTKEDIIKMFDEKYAADHAFLAEVDAYVAARMLKTMENVEQHNISQEQLKEYLGDTIQFWMGG